ncbi:MAG TPA: plastocyanin/azurin family copper-binding protein [Solirubrobacterales bacterium]
MTLLAAPGADAANTRVSISNFAWSNARVEIDLNEKVTWDWIGPDLAHSVTGTSANALGLDSDPTTDAPGHQLGYSFTLQFPQPGTYLFQCKLHSAVRGEVIVSDVPGNPSSDPGPQAPLNLDVKRPTLGAVSVKRQQLHGRGGTPTAAQISERGTLEAEYYRLRPKGGRKFNGYAEWKAFIGINRFFLGAHGKHFKARPGRYLAVLRATDSAANTSKPVRKRFAILG